MYPLTSLQNCVKKACAFQKKYLALHKTFLKTRSKYICLAEFHTTQFSHTIKYMAVMHKIKDYKVKLLSHALYSLRSLH